MDDRVSFDVYAELHNPSFVVEHQELDKQVAVTFGRPPASSQAANQLQVWFKDPDVVMELGRALITAGTQFQAQRNSRNEVTAV